MAYVGSVRRTMFSMSAFVLLAAASAALSTASAQSTYLPSIKIGTAALIAPHSTGSPVTLVGTTRGLAGPDAVESPALMASALEFLLEGLHLTKRLNKDSSGARALYRGRK